MIWEDRILRELDKNELRKFCNPFKSNENNQTDFLIILVFVPIVVKK